MALHEYEIEINGLPHTVQLDDEGAKNLGLTIKDAKSEKSPKTTRTRAPRKTAAPKAKAARTPRNKAVKPAANKAPAAAPADDSASDPGASE